MFIKMSSAFPLCLLHAHFYKNKLQHMHPSLSGLPQTMQFALLSCSLGFSREAK